MEAAVNKMTGHTASVFGMTDRGVIRAGAFADLVLFDPDTVRDTATFATPAVAADGILETWINGQSAYVHGAGATQSRAGRLITRNRLS
jgi:N-acyl-D-amino-acid deacylase